MKGFLRLIAKPNMWLALFVTAAFSFPFGNSVSAARSADRSAEFIIHADSISGDMLPPTLVIEDGKAYLRFHYTKATIHGLTLTKVLHTSKGPMTVKIKAPSATATNMKVDVSAFTFGGACLKLGEPVPQAGLKNVTLA
ncbi:MAG TPA: hypothetical protein VFK37_08310, partial [Bacillales bacterium]|nr:hypothetical protein [Bacillales bacterium]